jgi:recombination protein RecR
VELQKLIEFFKIFPGIGPRTAARYVRVYLSLPIEERQKWSKILSFFSKHDFWCPECGNFSIQGICPICSDNKRKKDILCVVENIDTLENIEKNGIFQGRYFVLGGLLTLDENSSTLQVDRIEKMESLIEKNKVKEIIFSLKLSVEGKVTINYIKEKLSEKFPHLKFTLLNFGLSPTADLSLADAPSLQESFLNRREI